MTPNAFKAAVVHLVVVAGPDGGVTARPIYSTAGGAFMRAGPGVWAWFAKRDAALDDGDARAEFATWLKIASEKEIDLFLKAAKRYREALIKAEKKEEEAVQRDRAECGEQAPENEIGMILKGSEARGFLRKTQRTARETAQRSENGSAKLGKGVRPKVLEIADQIIKEIESKGGELPRPWKLAPDIAYRVGKKPRWIYEILANPLPEDLKKYTWLSRFVQEAALTTPK
jgi:hypothetical protein